MLYCCRVNSMSEIVKIRRLFEKSVSNTYIPEILAFYFKANENLWMVNIAFEIDVKLVSLCHLLFDKLSFYFQSFRCREPYQQ